MSNATTKTKRDVRQAICVIREHGDMDKHMRRRLRSAIRGGWEDIADFVRVGYEAGLNSGGLWLCDHCCTAVADSAHPHCMEPPTELYGDIILCSECHTAAIAARAKIITISDDDGDEEDRSALVDDEDVLAGYLDQAVTARNRMDRDLIRGYPRDERRNLHRYQDDIDRSRNLAGKH